MGNYAKNVRELRVYQNAMEAAMEVYELTKKFPTEERYELSDQLRRSSRSVCRNLGEGLRKIRYKAAFIAKLSDSETEACETQVSLELAWRCGHIDKEVFLKLDERYDRIMAQIITMIRDADQWLIKVN